MNEQAKAFFAKHLSVIETTRKRVANCQDEIVRLRREAPRDLFGAFADVESHLNDAERGLQRLVQLTERYDWEGSTKSVVENAENAENAKTVTWLDLPASSSTIETP